MRLASTLPLLPLCLAMASAQTAHRGDSELTAEKVVRGDATIRGAGHVHVKFSGMVADADEATLNTATGTLELTGHVRATLPARDDHSLIRYASGAMVTDKPLQIHTDRMTVDKEALRAWGNIVVEPVDPDEPLTPQLRGDEMAMTVKTGDATMLGHLRTQHLPEAEAEPIQYPRRQVPLFPPDYIIK